MGLAGLRLMIEDELLLMRLEWEVGRAPKAPFAMIPEIYSSDGRRVYQSVYPFSAEGRNSRLLWPLINDVLPANRWRPGRRVVEKYGLRLRGPLPPGRGEVDLHLYRLKPKAVSEFIGTIRVPALIPRPS